MIARFVVHRLLGAGGTGVVYAAHDPDLDRTIALKLLRRELADLDDARARFLREAQALARLPHPHVISVYDVGAADGCTFIAMEYIRGRTFADWVAASPRSWSEVVAVLIKAGRGLAAAHAAGIIHRDFKPANLLVGDDGRIVVTDFGLARAAMTSTPDDQAGDPDEGAGRDGRGSTLAQSVTRTGAIQGTPAYMAPEQRQGQATDARADQFSFCVTLYEALFGVHPFWPQGAPSSASSPPQHAATIVGELWRPASRGAKPSAAPAIPIDSRGVPSWLQRIVIRGLRLQPEERYPGMDALLAALNREPARRRRLAWRAVGALIVALAAVGFTSHAMTTRGPAIELCAGADGQLAEIWNAPLRGEIRAGFAATGLSYAADTSNRVEPILNAYAAQWAAMHTEACRATRVRGEQSELVMDKRMACLDVRRHEFDQLTRLLQRPDATVVEHAVQAARGLSTIRDCDDLAALDRSKPPPDADTAARVRQVRQQLAEVRVLNDAGKYDDGLAVAAKLAGEKVTRDYLPLRAELSYWTGRLHASKADWNAALASTEDAIWAAEASGHDAIAVVALSAAINTQTELDHFREAHELLHRGEAALLRFTASAIDRVELRTNVCWLLHREVRPQEALPLCQEARALALRELGPDNLSVARALINLGAVLYQCGDYEQALGDSRGALAIYEKALGPDHPMVGRAAQNVAIDAYARGRIDEALQLAQRALAILEQRLGADNVVLISTLDTLGKVFRRQERYTEASAALQRAIAIVDKALGPGHSRAAPLHINLANVLVLQHDYTGAIEQNEHAAAILAATVGTRVPDYSGALMNICDAEYKRKRPREALAICMRALPALEQAVGLMSPVLADVLVNIAGPVYAANGKLREAIDAFERGIAHWPTQAPGGATELAAGELALARLLWKRAPRDHAQARALATSARDRFRDAGAGHEAQRSEADAWLASHRQ